MNKILVIFFIDRDLETVLEQDWMTAKDPDFLIDYTRRIWNCFDEGALASALSLKKAMPALLLDAITIAKEETYTESFANNLYALGFETVFGLVEQQRDPDVFACQIINAVPILSYDAVFAGQQMMPEDRPDLPVLIAQKLGLPCLSGVTDVCLKDSILEVASQEGFVERILDVRDTVVLSFGNAKHAYLELPSLRNKLSVKKKHIVWLNSEIKNDQLPVELCNYARDKELRSCVMTTFPLCDDLKALRLELLKREE